MINAIKQGWATVILGATTMTRKESTTGQSGDCCQSGPGSPRDNSKEGPAGAFAALREPVALRCEIFKMTDDDICKAYAQEKKEELEHALNEAIRRPSTHPPVKVINNTKQFLASMQAHFDAGCFYIDEEQIESVATVLRGENHLGVDGEGSVVYWFNLRDGEDRLKPTSLPNPDVTVKQHVKVRMSAEPKFYMIGDSNITKRQDG